MSGKRVTAVSCQKIDKKGKPNKALTFTLLVNWSDNTKDTKQIPHNSIIDFRNALAEKCPGDAEIPELPDAKKFEGGFLKGFEKRKTAIEEFFTKIVKSSDQCNDALREFFERNWSDHSVDTGASHPEDPKTPATPAPLNNTTPALDSDDQCHYECVDGPSAYASICFNPLNDAADPASTMTNAAGEPVYWAVQDYTRKTPKEVDLKVGASVTVVQKEMSGWWLVHVQDSNERGLAPAPLLLPEDKKHLADMTVSGVLGEYQAVEDRVGIGPDELSFKKKDRMEVLEARMDGWWKVRCNGQVGLTPRTHIEPVPAQPGVVKPPTVDHHAAVDKKFEPPPRRNDDDSLEELYAKVTKVHSGPQVPKKPPVITGILPPKIENKGLQLAPGAAAAANDDDDDDSLDADLYSKIPDSISPLRPEDYKSATADDDDPLQEVYENVPNTKTTATKSSSATTSGAKQNAGAQRYVNVQISQTDSDVKPVLQQTKTKSLPLPPTPSNAASASKPAPAFKPSKPTPTERNKTAVGASLSTVDTSPVKSSDAAPSKPAVQGTTSTKALPPTPTPAAATNGDVPKPAPTKRAPQPPNRAQFPNVIAAAAATAAQSLSSTKKSPTTVVEPAKTTKQIRILKLDRPECEKLLTLRGHERDYVIRESSKNGCPYALSVLCSDRVHHFPIVLTPEKKFYIGQWSFDSVTEVLEYYRENSLCRTDDGRDVTLGQQLDVTEQSIIARLL